MGRRAREAQADVVYWDGAVPADAPPNQLSDLYEGAADTEDLGYLTKAEAIYHNRWPELIAALPQTATCLGGSVTNRNPTGLVAAIWQGQLRGKPCLYCHSLEGEADMIVCDRCENCAHRECSTTTVH